MSDFDELAALTMRAIGDETDPYTGYAWSRREQPVELIGPNRYTLYRYQDVRAVLKDPETFSSKAYEEGIALVMGPTFLAMDGTEHIHHRGLVAGAFRRTALDRWRSEVMEPTVQRLIDALEPKDELVRALTLPLPVQVIAAILGVPVDDHVRFATLSITLIGMAADFDEGMAASRELRDYFSRIVEQRRREPRDDVISDLVRAEIDDEHMYGFLRLLLPAGMETTYRLLGNLLAALLSDRETWERVRDDRSLIDRAIEEALRWEAPVQYIDRLTTRAVSLGGTDLEAGTVVALALGSANRDETVFDDPDRFDIDRFDPDRAGPAHLAFADGPHRCLGEHLARAEVTVALNALLDRVPELRLVEPPVIRGHAFRSPERLDVTL